MMFENSQQIQLAILSIVITIMTIGCFAYIASNQPESLRMTRNGVPFFTADVIHPDTGKPIPVNELIDHYKSENSR
ncbi:MAG: hypothetical protein ACI845_003558 [Gammaproteobacteria bacterium]|jgi:hypothetical protein